MLRVLVTGSSGFIGSHVAHTLMQHGYDVTGIYIRQNTENQCTYRTEVCDILDVAQLKQCIENVAPEAIVHLAARTGLEGKNLQDYAVNIDGVRNLVRVLSTSSTVKRCIFTSTQLVCRVGYVPRHAEDYCPNTLYGKSKVIGEQIIRSEMPSSIEWCIVRPTTVWGPGMNTHYQQFFRLITQGLYFHIGRKPLRKSYGYVGNVAYQYLQLLRAPENLINHQTFYLADYEPISLQDWADAFQRALNAKPIRTLPVSLAWIGAKTGDLLSLVNLEVPFNSFRLRNILTEYVFDLRETERVCGPLPYSLEQGVYETVNWLRHEVFISSKPLSCQH